MFRAIELICIYVIYDTNLKDFSKLVSFSYSASPQNYDPFQRRSKIEQASLYRDQS